MASKKTKAKKRKKPSSRATASKRPKKRTPTKPAKKKAARKAKPKQAAKKRAAPKRKKAAKTQAAIPPLKTFAERVRDGYAGTEVWFRVGDGVAHGELRGRGAPGLVTVLSSGNLHGLEEGNVFETEAGARTAR